MPSITLPEASALSQDMLVSGVIEHVITVNEVFDVLPFDAFSGAGITYNRENVLGDVQALGIGGTITANNPTTFTPINDRLTTIIGDAPVNNLITFTESEENDQVGEQIAGKAKAAGREYQRQLINGTGAANEFQGMLALVDESQKVNTGVDGTAISFPILDQLAQLVTAKDNQLDYYMMPGRTIVSYRALLRGLGGTSMTEVTTPTGRRVDAYMGVPIFRNDWIPTNQTKGTGGAVKTTIFAGTFDDGSRTNGIAGLTARRQMGVSVINVGEAEQRDERIYRVRWYCGLALFSARAIASADGITN